MADNSPSSGGAGDVISTDDLATINGGATSGVKVQRMKVGFGSDSDLRDVDATHGLPVSLNAAAFIFSTNNSTTAQLAAGATFTGTIEAVLDQPSLSLLLTSDQPVTITVYPLIDSGGTFAGAPIVYYANANQGFSTSLPLNCNYLKVTVKNTGTATTTTLNLSTAYGNLPSADTKGRVPVSADDCAPLLVASITATGVSSTIDTIGYQAIVVQLTGAWAGSAYFESSNSGSANEWDQIMCYTSGVPMLQDVVISNGSYIIRPSGRYLRLNVPKITGTMGLNALGRSDIGISPADYLSLAMDSANSMPAQVQAQGSAGLVFAQDPISGAGKVIPAVRNINGTLSATTGIGSVVGPFMCSDMQGISFTAQYPSGSAATIVVEAFVGSAWQSLFVTQMSSGNSYSFAASIAVTAGQSTFCAASLMGAAMVRVRATVIGGSMFIQGQLLPQTLGYGAINAFQSGTWTVSATQTSATTIATTNGQSLSQTIITATAAAVVQVKASAGRITMLNISNGAANAGYLHLQNNAAATTSTASVMTFAIPATAGANIPIALPQGGLFLSTGIAFTVSGAIASGDTTALTAPSIAVNISYI